MNTKREIDDVMLSAYLDGELPAQDLLNVRAALARDPALAARLAALQEVNTLVVHHARALDATPFPTSVLALLQPEARPTATVVQGPWQRWSRHAGAQLALAASLVLALGFALNNLFEPVPSELPAFAAYANLLDTAPSGTSELVDGAMLVNRFSFRGQDDSYCRQYQLSTATVGTENVACRAAGGWTLVASLPVPVDVAPDAYQPASSSAELNAVLDAMMQGPALDLATEAALIERGWQDN